MPIRRISVLTCRRPILLPSAASRPRNTREPAKRKLQMQPVEPLHDHNVGRRHRTRQIINAAAADLQSFRPQSTSPPPSARDARSRDPKPSEPHAPGPRLKTCSLSCSSWLHLLKSWSLRQSRGGSLSNQRVSGLTSNGGNSTRLFAGLLPMQRFCLRHPSKRSAIDGEAASSVKPLISTRLVISNISLASTTPNPSPRLNKMLAITSLTISSKCNVSLPT